MRYTVVYNAGVGVHTESQEKVRFDRNSAVHVFLQKNNTTDETNLRLEAYFN